VASPYPFELNLQLYVSLLFLIFILVAMLVYAFSNNFEVNPNPLNPKPFTPHD